MTSSNGNTVVAPGELTFLVELRDYLNSAASPATGSTIAFSTFVSDRAGGFRAEDARKAYPGYRTLARQLRWFVTTISFLALLSTVVLAGLAAYVYWGNAIVNAAANVYTQEADFAEGHRARAGERRDEPGHAQLREFSAKPFWRHRRSGCQRWANTWGSPGDRNCSTL